MFNKMSEKDIDQIPSELHTESDIMKNASNINFTDLYLNWLKENIEQYKIKDNIFRMTFPFLDRNNDFTEFYIIQRDNGTYCLTDDGATISKLQYSGFEFNKSKHRKAILNSVIAAYGVTLTKDNELTITCTLDELPLKKHILSQCMIKVGDLFYLSKTNVQSVLLEDIQIFFDENDIRYVENVPIKEIYRKVHYEYVLEDVKSFAEENNIELTDDEAEEAAYRYVYDCKYDCNLSYWQNIENVILYATNRW